MYDDKQFCWNSFSSSHILSTSDAANRLFAFVPMSRDFKELKYFLSLTSINKNSVADTLFYFGSADYTNILIWQICSWCSTGFPFLCIICILMAALFEIFQEHFKFCSKINYKWKVPNGTFFAQNSFNSYISWSFFTFYFTLVFGRKVKKYYFKFSRFSINQTTTFWSVTHRVAECFIAYSKTMFVTSPIDL